MYKPSPLDTTDIKLPAELQELAEEMARNVHENWAYARIKEGWKWGESRNDDLKEHPCLIEYESLPESEKEYDRQTAIETLKFIIAHGYKISSPK